MLCCVFGGIIKAGDGFPSGVADTVINPTFLPGECTGGWLATEKPDRLIGRMCRWLADNGKISYYKRGMGDCGYSAPLVCTKEYEMSNNPAARLLSHETSSKIYTDVTRCIVECAKLYRDNLENKNYLFVATADKGASFSLFEAAFLPRNYAHLTGVKYNKGHASSVEFYDAALSGRLMSTSYDIPNDGNVPRKMEVLHSLMNIHQHANMIGVYDGSKIRLHTNQLVGTISACMGFVVDKDAASFVPNTALKQDMREITGPRMHVVAVLSKQVGVEKYSSLRYSHKNYKDVLSTIDALNERTILPLIEDFGAVVLS